MDIPSPFDGGGRACLQVGRGGGGQDRDLYVPPPLHPLPRGMGKFIGLCLFNYGLLGNYRKRLDSCLRRNDKK